MSHMAREAAEAPEAVARFLQRNGSSTCRNLAPASGASRRPSSSHRRAAVPTMPPAISNIWRKS